MKWIDCTHHDEGYHDLVTDDGELLMCCCTWGITQEQFDAIPKQAEENKRLTELILSLKHGFTYVGSAYSGHPTSRKVERLLEQALDIFKPARVFIREKEQALKGGQDENR
jgi:hypothetical protein